MSGHAGKVRRGFGIGFCVLEVLAALLMAGSRAATAQSLEYEIKATYLYKFAAFIQWPPTAFTAPDSPFFLCVAGNGPVGPLLDQAVSDKQVGGRSFVVRHLPSAANADAGCHILYIDGAGGQALATVPAPVVTITDAAKDASAKGIINFVTQDNRVRFEINNGVALKNGLNISSKLLSLAISVNAGS